MNCSQQCTGHCRDNTPCNHVTGQCDGGCAAGWTGSQCDNGELASVCWFLCLYFLNVCLLFPCDHITLFVFEYLNYNIQFVAS